MFEENGDTTRLFGNASDNQPPWSARRGSRGSFVTYPFDVNGTVIAYAIRYQNRNGILGQGLADQGGRCHTARLESRYRPMGVAPRVSEYPSNRPTLAAHPGGRRDSRIPLNAQARVDEPVSGVPANLNVNRRFASTTTANSRIPVQHAGSSSSLHSATAPRRASVKPSQHWSFAAALPHASKAGRYLYLLWATSRPFG
jgi:hypothetical protein